MMILPQSTPRVQNVPADFDLGPDFDDAFPCDCRDPSCALCGDRDAAAIGRYLQAFVELRDGEPHEAPATASDLDWEARRSSAYSAGWDDARRGLPRRDADGYTGREWLTYLRGRSHCLAELVAEIDAADERTALAPRPGDDWHEAERVAVLGARAYHAGGGAS